MKELLKLLILITYTVIIFFINSYTLLAIVLVTNILILFVFHVNIRKLIRALLSLIFILLFTGAINAILSSIENAILVDTKLILAFMFVYSYKKVLSPIEIGEALEKLFIPLKLVGVNPKDISLIVNIAITFVPILTNELMQIKYALKAKGYMGIKARYFAIRVLLFNVLKKTVRLEWGLKAKGYAENGGN
ncbi:MAG: energy-coupling factor transporter transmembrane protein EcfT [Lachnospiraceae bacterium]|jgi:energy-coupling factor transport system permease protein|nr:energy-coupling factor transporter transmembrane protein EcfT [Lachnospiraceae bacterium]